MSRLSAFRIPSYSGVPWCAHGVGAGNPTEGWQDKRAHIAHRLGGSFSWASWRVSHLAAILRNVRQTPKALYPHPFFHIAGQRHG